MAEVIGEFVAQIGADLGKFKQGLDGADKRMNKFAAGMKKHSRAIGIGMTAMGGAIVGTLGLATKSAADFEAGMREVNTMMGLGQEEFKAMSADVLDLAKNLGVDAVESTQALYQAISAGIPKENVLTFMEIATKAAIGGVTSTEVAVDGLTTVLNAFKMDMSETQRVADIMFTTVKRGKTTFDELASKMFNVAPIAAASGIAFEEVTAAIATMTKQGFPTAQATTAIRQAMVALQKPTKEMTEVIKDLGYESGQLMIQEIGFAETLNLLRNATEGSNELLMKMFGSVEAGGAVLALTGENAQMFTDDLKAMKTATDGLGASTEAFNEIEQGAARQLEKVQNQIKAQGIEIGATLLPALLPLIKELGAWVKWIDYITTKNPELTETILKVAAVVGGLLVILGPLVIMLPGLSTAFGILAGAFTLLLGPVGLVILAVGTLVLAGIALYQNWNTIWTGIVRYTTIAVNAVIDVINSLIDVMNLIPGVDIGKIGVVGKPDIELTEHAKQALARLELESLGEPGLPFERVVTPELSPMDRRRLFGDVNINVEGSVVTERELIESFREEIIKIGEGNYTTGF